ncbi:MAG: DUF2339 domain-containing protein [Betaproteobacteria bacterium]|nr:DUF2339 domain-containing protein [Betaproteobacteria bacterium]
MIFEFLVLAMAIPLAVIITLVILFTDMTNIRKSVRGLQEEVDKLKKRLDAQPAATDTAHPIAEEPVRSAPILVTPALHIADIQPAPESAISPGPLPIAPESAVAWQEEEICPPAPATLDKPLPASLEQFSDRYPYFANMTAGKIFSWIGGFLLFLGIIYGIKYSVENDLISPQMRLISGMLFGLGLIVASFFIKAEKYKVTADTLCGSGLAVLYAVIFCAKYFYDYLPIPVAFTLMEIVSIASFGLAVHKRAQYIGYLGVITGFLTPFILSTGLKNYLALFTYLAFINAGAIAAGIKGRWEKLICATVIFSLLSQFVWFFPNFDSGRTNIFCIIFAAYAGSAAAIAYYCRDMLGDLSKRVLAGYIIGSFILIFMTDMPLIVIGLAFFMNALLVGLLYLEPRVYGAYFKLISIAAFLLLARWLPSDEGRNVGDLILLMTMLLFMALNTFIGMRRDKEESDFASYMPAAAMLLLLLIPGTSLFTLYTFTLIFLLAALVFALRGGNVIAAFFALIVFAALMHRGLWSYRFDFGLTEVIFVATIMTGLLYGLRFLQNEARPKGIDGLGILAVLMPYYFLMVYVCRQNALVEYAFGICAILTAIILTVSYFNKNRYYPLYALAGSFVLRILLTPMYHDLSYTIVATEVLIFALFLYYPFLCRKRDSENAASWIVGSLAGVSLLVASIFQANVTYGSPIDLTSMAAFVAVCYFFALALVYERPLNEAIHRRVSYLSAVFFMALTVIIGNETTSNWLPTALALEGAAMLWLHERFKVRWFYQGGALLLAVAFAWLLWLFIKTTLVDIIPVDAAGISWNLMFTYGLGAAAMFFGSIFANKTELEKEHIPGILLALSWVTVFILINLQIAHYYSDGFIGLGTGDSLAKTVAYTLAWSIYGMLTLFAGIGSGKARYASLPDMVGTVDNKARYIMFAGIGLVFMALLKLAVHDFWMLSTLYKAVICITVAIVLVAGSFLYQAMTRAVRLDKGQE